MHDDYSNSNDFDDLGGEAACLLPLLDDEGRVPYHPIASKERTMAAPSRGHNTVPGGGGLHHVALRAADFEASLRFYCDGLGFRVAARWDENGAPAALLDGGDGSYIEVFGGGTTDTKPEGALLHLALRTTNCDAAVERARAAGARITDEAATLRIDARPQPFTVRLAFCTGPDGETIEFFQSDDL